MHGIPLAGVSDANSFICSWKSSGRDRSKERNKWQSTTLASICVQHKVNTYNKVSNNYKVVIYILTIAKTLPMHILGPTPKGMYEYRLKLMEREVYFITS